MKPRAIFFSAPQQASSRHYTELAERFIGMRNEPRIWAEIEALEVEIHRNRECRGDAYTTDEQQALATLMSLGRRQGDGMRTIDENRLDESLALQGFIRFTGQSFGTEDLVIVRCALSGETSGPLRAGYVNWSDVSHYKLVSLTKGDAEAIMREAMTADVPGYGPAAPEQVEAAEQLTGVLGGYEAAPEYTGASVSYYKVRISAPVSGGDAYMAECQDIIEALGMDFNEGNAFKAIWRRAAARTLGLKKRGYDDGLYDAEKVAYAGKRLVELSKGVKGCEVAKS